MDFVSDAPCGGRRLRALTVVYAFTREALATDVDHGMKGELVVAVMAQTTMVRRAPKAISVNKGPEFISKALDRWPYENGVTRDFSRRASLRTVRSSSNGRLCGECLNTHCFSSLAAALDKIEAWRRHVTTWLLAGDAGR